MSRITHFVSIAAVSLVPALVSAQTTPKSGAEVLQRMRDAYNGKWYRSLTFVQTTTRYRDGAQNVSTWFESLWHSDAGTRLRIDIGDPSAGNGMLYTADSTWRINAGKVARVDTIGNEFLPLIEGAYLQPVSRTIVQLKATGVDMARVSKAEWRSRPAWVVGASSPADTTSPQFWIDAERNVVVRMILVPAANAPTLDIHLDGYVPLEGGWLATKIAMYSGGKPFQTEEYSEWKANVELPKALFDPAQWTTSPHWAKGRVSKP